MKRIISTLCLIISIACGSFSVCWSDDFQKGMEAYKKDDFANAIKEWILLGDDGNEKAQYFLGEIYYKGKGIPQDYKKALKWNTLSAKQGNKVAQYNLGIMYSFGLGVVPDYKTALKWYNLSSEQGNALAQYNLGRLYYLGQGVTENIVYAHMWANQSSINGFSMGEELTELLIELMSPVQIEEARQIIIPKQNDGHFHLNLTINGKTIEFLVDTGASEIVLNQKDAEALGFNDRNLEYWAYANTANGRVRLAPVRLETVSLGGYIDKNVKAAVNEGEMRSSLLGMSYLNKFNAIEIKSNQMILMR